MLSKTKIEYYIRITITEQKKDCSLNINLILFVSYTNFPHFTGYSAHNHVNQSRRELAVENRTISLI